MYGLMKRKKIVKLHDDLAKYESDVTAKVKENEDLN